MFTQRKSKRSQGFSLLELVIVVVIIGIIAAIAVPRMSRGAKGADESALKGSLAVMRNAIDLYAAEHGGTFPAGAANVVTKQLTTYSNVTGTPADAKNTANGTIYGPYVKSLPAMPLGTKKGDATIVVVTGATNVPSGAGTAGWWYNSTTGEVRANLADTETGDENKAFNKY